MAEFEPMMSLTADEVLDATQAFREHFGVTVNPRENPEEFENAINEVDPRFKGERKYIDIVRFQLEADRTDYSIADQRHIMRAAGALDLLLPETPLVGEFDIIAALGAARVAPYDRMKYAAEAVRSGKAAGRLVGVASTRVLASGEVEAAAVYNAPEDSQTEADLEHAAARKIGEEFDIDVPVLVVDNPRAHNALLVDEIQRAYPNARALGAVTTQIYQTRTSLDFARQGGMHSIQTAVAGNPSDKQIVANRTPATYQSEVAAAQKSAAKHFLR